MLSITPQHNFTGVCLRQQEDECSAAHRSITLPACVLDSKMMSAQQHTAAALYPRKDQVPNLQEAGCVLLFVCTSVNSPPTTVRSPDRPATVSRYTGVTAWPKFNGHRLRVNLINRITVEHVRT